MSLKLCRLIYVAEDLKIRSRYPDVSYVCLLCGVRSRKLAPLTSAGASLECGRGNLPNGSGAENGSSFTCSVLSLAFLLAPVKAAWERV